MLTFKKIMLPVAISLLSTLVMAQPKPEKQTSESTEQWSPVPRVVTPGTPAVNASPASAPSDAIILFDGKDLSNWKASGKDSAAGWTVSDGIMTVKKGTGSIETKQKFDDFQLHIEFRTPAEVKGNGQERGNSGVFMQGIYELQVLDSYNNPTYVNGSAGSIYKRYMPLVNASRKPGEWQTYDVAYLAPKFNKDSLVIVPGYITVFHNGVLIQNHTPIIGTTPNKGQFEYTPHGKGPIMLQDHNNPTSFRNIWIREL